MWLVSVELRDRQVRVRAKVGTGSMEIAFPDDDMPEAAALLAVVEQRVRAILAASAREDIAEDEWAIYGADGRGLS